MTPRVAIIGNNTLQAMGLKSVLSEIIPIAEVCTYSTLADMEKDEADSFFHYFVSAHVVLESPSFFIQHRHKTIVLVTQASTAQQFANFHTLDICVPEYKLVKSILLLHQTNHHGEQEYGYIPPHAQGVETMAISQREAEVQALVVKGYINKEIADKLNISIPTVVTHRKNITEKLRLKSVSALTIYAVTHGIVSVDEI